MINLTLCIAAVAILSLLVTLSTIRKGKQTDRIPGPFLNRLSYWPLKIQVLKGNRIHYIHKLHHQYGPCVLISPSEIAISDLASTKQIHRIGGGFLKSPWYQSFTEESSNPGIFAMVNPKAHSIRRKLFSNAFSQNTLLGWEELLESKVRLALSGMKRQSAVEGSADILQWWTFMASDVIGELGFGESFRALEHGEKSVYSKDLETTMFFSGIRSELPFAISIMRFLPFRAIKHQLQATDRLLSYGSAAIERNMFLSDRGEVKHTLFSKMLDVNSDDERTDSLPMEDIKREAANLIVAGSDTTAVTLTYLIWAVLSYPAVKDRLMAELGSVSVFSSSEFRKLPYLAAVIQEVLRLYGAAPGSLPRTVPKGGRVLGGHFIPQGMVVSTQAWTLHRDEAIFDRPEEFLPERWIDPSINMKEAFMPFGGGSRVCIGLHLAHMELALGAASFLREFPSARIAPSVTSDDMSAENYFLIAPKSHKCNILL